MKKLGLRAVAGGLALLLTASVFAPATPANAADVLLIAQAPKTLVITADMVDDDGEIVISNEKWDRIVIEKEAAAKDIYFDGVEVGELVVESGNSAKIQLWDVDAEQVTVKEPELDDITLKDLATLLADKETRSETLEMYFAIRAKNNSAKTTAPTIVTMEDAKVDKMVARANAALDLAAGEVGVVALEASSEVTTARVTLKNYKGDVAFTGTEGRSNMILNNVNSTIENLKVEESAANNSLTVNSQGSLIKKAEVSGDAKVSLNIPTKSLEVTEDATAANVRVLNKVDEMAVAADSAKVEVTASGMVSDAVVTGDKVNIGGNGCLTNVEITGSDAYVSTEGTKVEGENTYVKPVYVETPKDLEYEIGLLPSDGWNNTKLSSNDGGEHYKLNDNYGGEVFYTFPNAIDAAKYEEVVIKVKVDSDSPDALRVKLTHVGADKDEWGNPVPFFMSEVPSGSGEVEVVLPLDIHAGKMIDQVRFQSTADGTVATFYSISFKARLDGPAEPIVLPTEGTQCNPNSWEVVVYDSVDFRKYAGTTVKITAEALRCGGSVGPKAQRQFNNDPDWTEIEKNSYIEIGTDWTDFGAESFEVPAAWATAPKPIYYGIRTVNGEDYSRCLIFQKGFSVELLEGEIAPEQPDVPVIPEGAYTFDKVVKAKDGWNASFVLNENKGAVITYTGDYSQAFFTIPDDVDITKLESVTLNGIDVSGYMIRLLTAGNLDSYNGNNSDIDGNWDTPTVSTNGKTDIKYIVLMSQKAQEIVVDSVSFKLKDASDEGGNGNQGGTEDDDQSGETPSETQPKYSDSFDSSVGAFTAMWGAPMEFNATEGHTAAGSIKVSAGEYGAVVNVNLANALPEGIKLSDQNGKKLTASVWVKTEEAGEFKLSLKADGDKDTKDAYIGALEAGQWAKITFQLDKFEYVNDNAVLYVQDYGSHEDKLFYVDDFEFEFTGTTASEPSNPGTGDDNQGGTEGDNNQGGTEEETVKLPALPEGLDIYTFTDESLTKAADDKAWGYDAKAVTEAGALEASFTAQYAEALYFFSKTYTLGEIKNLILTLSDVTDDIVVKLYDAEGSQIGVWYGVTATDVENKYCGMTYLGNNQGEPILDTLDKTTKVGGFGVMALNGACDATIHRVAVETQVVEGGNQGGTGDGEPTAPEVTVTIAELDNNTLTLEDTVTLKAVASVSGSAITWTSSKPEVATVDENGVVTPVSAGLAIITATCGDAEDSVELVVDKAFYLKTWNDTANKFVICSKDVPFEGSTKEEYGSITANTIAVYGLEYLSGMLPEALSGTVDLSTFDAISENVDKFVFEATVTKCTGEGTFFQAGVQAGQSYSYAGKFTDYSDAVSIRGVSDTNPVVVITEVTMDEVISAGVVELSQVTGQIVANEEGIDVAGTCTVKVVLK